MPHPYRGREFIHMAKLKTANDKVKFMDVGFFTLVFTFFLIIFYSRIVDSEFCCMFTPTNKQTTKNTTIMKTIKVTYTEVQYVTYTKEIQVTNAQLKELQKEGQFHGQLLEAMEHQAAQHGETIVNSRQMELNF